MENTFSKVRSTFDYKRIVNMSEQLQSYINIDLKDNMGTLEIEKRFEQIGVASTIDFLVGAVLLFLEKHPSMGVKVDLGNIGLQERLLSYLIKMINDIIERGSKVEIISNDTDMSKSILANIKVVDLEPQEIVVKDYYNVDTISKINSKAWELLRSLLVKNTSYTFDFKGIELVEPWVNESFNKLMSDSRVHLRLYSSPKTAYTINTMCLLGGLEVDRVENIEIEAPKVKTAEEKKVEAIGKQLQPYFQLDDEKNTATFNITSRYDQVGNINTVNYILEAIRVFNENNRQYSIILDAGTIFIQKNIIELIAKELTAMNKNGIDVQLVSHDKDTNTKVNIHRQLNKTDKFDTDGRAKSFSKVRSGTVGMISKYRSSRSVDEFGRQGNGEVVSCRVAIYCGTKDGTLYFRAFSGNTFYTMQHWMMENDGEELEYLEEIEIKADVTEVGLYGEFLGSKYHFMKPVQYDNTGYTTMYKPGELKVSKLTIPERIKVVLEDWKQAYSSNGKGPLVYDEESLDYYIKETKKVLGE